VKKEEEKHRARYEVRSIKEDTRTLAGQGRGGRKEIIIFEASRGKGRGGGKERKPTEASGDGLFRL
jgi:hypothetical protein